MNKDKYTGQYRKPKAVRERHINISKPNQKHKNYS